MRILIVIMQAALDWVVVEPPGHYSSRHSREVSFTWAELVLAVARH